MILILTHCSLKLKFTELQISDFSLILLGVIIPVVEGAVILRGVNYLLVNPYAKAEFLFCGRFHALFAPMA